MSESYPLIVHTIEDALRDHHGYFERRIAVAQNAQGMDESQARLNFAHWRGKLKSIDAALEWLKSAPTADWENAPAEAVWWTVDANGWAYWGTIETFASNEKCEWMVKAKGGQFWFAGEIDIPLGIDWRTLKECRPVEERTSP